MQERTETVLARGPGHVPRRQHHTPVPKRWWTEVGQEVSENLNTGNGSQVFPRCGGLEPCDHTAGAYVYFG